MKIRSSKLHKVVAATNKYDTKLIAKWLKAKFEDEAFGTAYTTHHISDADAYMGRNGLTYNRKNNTIDLIGNTREEDVPIYKVIPQYSHPKRQGTYPPKLPKIIPIEEYNATHGITSSKSIKATDWNPHLVKLSSKDAEYAMKNLDKTTAYLDDLDLKQYRTEFQPGTPGYMWSSKAGLGLLDKAGIKYELISKDIDASLSVPTKPVKSSKRVIGKYVKSNSEDQKMETFKFDSAEEIYDYLRSGDLYCVDDSTYMFEYNEAGSICCYTLSLDELYRAQDKAGDEEISGYLGGGGDIIDVCLRSPDGELIEYDDDDFDYYYDEDDYEVDYTYIYDFLESYVGKNFISV